MATLYSIREYCSKNAADYQKLAGQAFQDGNIELASEFQGARMAYLRIIKKIDGAD